MQLYYKFLISSVSISILFQFYYRCNYTIADLISSMTIHLNFNSTIDAIIPNKVTDQEVVMFNFNSTIDAIIRIPAKKHFKINEKFQFYYRCNYTFSPSSH